MVEYLFALDDTAFAATTEVIPKFVSHADPSSQWTATHHGLAYLTYSDNYLIDTDNAVIVDVQATRSVRTDETHATRLMIDRVHERFDLRQGSLIADMAYGSAEMMECLVDERGIEPHIPLTGKSIRTNGMISREDSVYHHRKDTPICPAGKELRQGWTPARTYP